MSDKLATALGLPPGQFREIAQRVRENHDRLAACAKHEFSLADGSDATSLNRKYRCASCSGTVDGHAFHWWERGKRDA